MGIRARAAGANLSIVQRLNAVPDGERALSTRHLVQLTPCAAHRWPGIGEESLALLIDRAQLEPPVPPAAIRMEYEDGSVLRFGRLEIFSVTVLAFAPSRKVAAVDDSFDQTRSIMTSCPKQQIDRTSLEVQMRSHRFWVLSIDTIGGPRHYLRVRTSLFAQAAAFHRCSR